MAAPVDTTSTLDTTSTAALSETSSIVSSFVPSQRWGAAARKRRVYETEFDFLLRRAQPDDPLFWEVNEHRKARRSEAAEAGYLLSDQHDDVPELWLRARCPSEAVPAAMRDAGEVPWLKARVEFHDGSSFSAAAGARRRPRQEYQAAELPLDGAPLVFCFKLATPAGHAPCRTSLIVSLWRSDPAHAHADDMIHETVHSVWDLPHFTYEVRSALRLDAKWFPYTLSGQPRAGAPPRPSLAATPGVALSLLVYESELLREAALAEHERKQRQAQRVRAEETTARALDFARQRASPRARNSDARRRHRLDALLQKKFRLATRKSVFKLSTDLDRQRSGGASTVERKAWAYTVPIVAIVQHAKRELRRAVFRVGTSKEWLLVDLVNACQDELGITLRSKRQSVGFRGVRGAVGAFVKRGVLGSEALPLSMPILEFVSWASGAPPAETSSEVAPYELVISTKHVERTKHSFALRCEGDRANAKLSGGGSSISALLMACLVEEKTGSSEARRRESRVKVQMTLFDVNVAGAARDAPTTVFCEVELHGAQESDATHADLASLADGAPLAAVRSASAHADDDADDRPDAATQIGTAAHSFRTDVAKLDAPRFFPLPHEFTVRESELEASAFSVKVRTYVQDVGSAKRLLGSAVFTTHDFLTAGRPLHALPSSDDALLSSVAPPLAAMYRLRQPLGAERERLVEEERQQLHIRNAHQRAYEAHQCEVQSTAPAGATEAATRAESSALVAGAIATAVADAIVAPPVAAFTTHVDPVLVEARADIQRATVELAEQAFDMLDPAETGYLEVDELIACSWSGSRWMQHVIAAARALDGSRSLRRLGRQQWRKSLLRERRPASVAEIPACQERLAALALGVDDIPGDVTMVYVHAKLDFNSVAKSKAFTAVLSDQIMEPQHDAFGDAATGGALESSDAWLWWNCFSSWCIYEGDYAGPTLTSTLAHVPSNVAFPKQSELALGELITRHWTFAIPSAGLARFLEWLALPAQRKVVELMEEATAIEWHVTRPQGAEQSWVSTCTDALFSALGAKHVVRNEVYHGHIMDGSKVDAMHVVRQDQLCEQIYVSFQNYVVDAADSALAEHLTLDLVCAESNEVLARKILEAPFRPQSRLFTCYWLFTPLRPQFASRLRESSGDQRDSFTSLHWLEHARSLSSVDSIGAERQLINDVEAALHPITVVVHLSRPIAELLQKLQQHSFLITMLQTGRPSELERVARPRPYSTRTPTHETVHETNPMVLVRKGGDRIALSLTLDATQFVLLTYFGLLQNGADVGALSTRLEERGYALCVFDAAFRKRTLSLFDQLLRLRALETLEVEGSAGGSGVTRSELQQDVRAAADAWRLRLSRKSAVTFSFPSAATAEGSRSRSRSKSLVRGVHQRRFVNQEYLHHLEEARARQGSAFGFALGVEEGLAWLDESEVAQCSLELRFPTEIDRDAFICSFRAQSERIANFISWFMSVPAAAAISSGSDTPLGDALRTATTCCWTFVASNRTLLEELRWLRRQTFLMALMKQAASVEWRVVGRLTQASLAMLKQWSEVENARGSPFVRVHVPEGEERLRGFVYRRPGQLMPSTLARPKDLIHADVVLTFRGEGSMTRFMTTFGALHEMVTGHFEAWLMYVHSSFLFFL